jgi:hypothetical protein
VSSQIDTVAADFMHQRGTLAIRARRERQGAHGMAGLGAYFGAQVGEAIHLGKAIIEIVQKDCDIVVGVGTRLAPRAGAKKHDPGEARAIKIIERPGNAREDWITDGSKIRHDPSDRRGASASRRMSI